MPTRVLPSPVAAALAVFLFTFGAAPGGALAGERLELRAGSFDPRQTPAPRAVDQPAAASPYRVVQLDHAPTRADRARLGKLGFEVVSYLPVDAWVVRARVPGRAATVETAVREMAGVRWLGALPPSWRIDPDLLPYADDMTLPAPLPAPGEPLYLQATSYRGAARYGASADLKSLRLPAGARPYAQMQDSAGRVVTRIAVTPETAGRVARSLARLPHTEWVDFWALSVTFNDDSAVLLQGGDPDLGTAPLWERGITGAGQIVGVTDSGLDTDACQFRFSADAGAQTLANDTQPPNAQVTNPDNKVLAYYVLGSSEAYDDSGGAFHGTHTAGNAVGDAYTNLSQNGDPGRDLHDGVAPGARLVFQDIGNNSGQLVGLNASTPLAMHRQAFASGVRIHNNSYGAPFRDPFYGDDSALVDEAGWALPDYLIVFAAGNSGPGARSLNGTGTTAKNSLVVGATRPFSSGRAEALADFSSQGPTADNRVKPDVVAPGIVFSATETETVNGGCCDQFGRTRRISTTDPPNNQCAVDTEPLSGTSYSAPLAAGAAALARQYFTDGFYPSGFANAADSVEPSAALLKAVLTNGAVSLTDGVRGRRGLVADLDIAPSYAQGWGRINLDQALHFGDEPRRLMVLADVRSGQDGALETGDAQTFTIEKVAPGGVLVVSLSWTDPAGTAQARQVLVNDLDLEVEAPNGTLFRGNVSFDDDLSNAVEASDDRRDTDNNIEQVRIPVEIGGTYTVRVTGTRVPGNGDDGAFDSQQQGFALIATGNVELGDPEPRMELLSSEIRGGCDLDGSLERGEQVDLRLELRNVGSAAAEGATVSVRVAEDSEVPAGEVTIGGGSVDLGGLEPGDTTTATVELSMPAEIESRCGEQLSLEIVASARGVEDRSFTFSLPVDIDFASTETFLGGGCEDAPCTAPPEVLEVSPAAVVRGETISELRVRGRAFADGVSLVLGPDLVAGNVERIDAETLLVTDLRVTAEALPGARNVVVRNPDDQVALGLAALTVQLAIEGSIPTTTSSSSDSGCGCRSAAPAESLSWVLGLVLLAIRRRD